MMKLKGHEHANCYVYTDGDTILFVSYRTIAAVLNGDWLSIHCLCSATTRKQVGWFLREYCPTVTYQTARTIFDDDLKVNVRTGEVESILL